MDEKGFLLGRIHKVKRVVSKKAWKKGLILGAVQDGSREWISLLACICMDGTKLPPGVIYQALTGNLQDSWLEDYNPKDQEAFFASSPNGWTSDQLGYAWLTRVFDQNTRQKARKGRDWRLLILDGHSSHVNMQFLDWCERNRVLVAVFPPHSTHRLQPLDVSLFSPLAHYYQELLNKWIHETQALSSMSKRRFWKLFWPAWQLAFTEKNIESGWKKTGLNPFDPNVVLHQIQNPTESSRPSTQASRISTSDWRKVRREIASQIDARVQEFVERVVAENDVLRHENAHLREHFKDEKKRRRRGKPLFDNVFEITKGNAMFFSPSKIQAARKNHEEKEAEELQKKKEKDEKARIRELKKQQEAERKKERQRVKAVKEAEKEKEAIEKAERSTPRSAKKQLRAQKKQAKSPVKKAKNTRQNSSSSLTDNFIEISSDEDILPQTPISRPRREKKLPERFSKFGNIVESFA